MRTIRSTAPTRDLTHPSPTYLLMSKLATTESLKLLNRDESLWPLRSRLSLYGSRRQPSGNENLFLRSGKGSWPGGSGSRPGYPLALAKQKRRRAWPSSQKGFPLRRYLKGGSSRLDCVIESCEKLLVVAKTQNMGGMATTGSKGQIQNREDGRRLWGSLDYSLLTHPSLNAQVKIFFSRPSIRVS